MKHNDVIGRHRGTQGLVVEPIDKQYTPCRNLLRFSGRSRDRLIRALGRSVTGTIRMRFRRFILFTARAQTGMGRGGNYKSCCLRRLQAYNTLAQRSA